MLNTWAYRLKKQAGNNSQLVDSYSRLMNLI